MDKEQEKKKAEEALKEDFGEEGYRVLMEGVDAIIDVTDKFGMPYRQVREKIKKSAEKGLIKESGGMIIGLEKKDEQEEE